MYKIDEFLDFFVTRNPLYKLGFIKMKVHAKEMFSIRNGYKGS